jgi:hypothetical protein
LRKQDERREGGRMWKKKAHRRKWRGKRRDTIMNGGRENQEKKKHDGKRDGNS